MDDNGSNIYTVIEIGTENMRILMGRECENQGVQILGYASCHSNRTDTEGSAQINSIRKGEPRNLQRLSDNLKNVIDDIEYETKTDILSTRIYIGVTGNGIDIRNEETSIPIQGRDSVITQEDEIDVLKRAREAFQTIGHGTCLMTYTRFFRTDSHRELFSAVGQRSRRLTGAIQGIILKAEAGSNLSWVVLSALGDRVEYAPQVKLRTLYLPVALPYGALLSRNIQETTLMIDIGAGVTSYCISNQIGILDSGHLPVGCNQIENDLAQAFGVSWSIAKMLLRKMSSDFADASANGIACSVMNPDDHRRRTAIVEKRAGRRDRIIPISSIEKVVAARLTEIFVMVMDRLQENNLWKYVNNTIFISGGGAMIPGVEELASRVLKRDAELARPPAFFHGDETLLNDPRSIIPLGLMKLAIADTEIKQTGQPGGVKEFLLKRILSFLKMAINW